MGHMDADYRKGPGGEITEARRFSPKDKTMSGIERIAAERKRQIDEETWTPEHDDEHQNGELALGAAAYALPPVIRERSPGWLWGIWPWGERWWKPSPKNRIKELTKAGALIAAEIDRLERAAASSQ